MKDSMTTLVIVHRWMQWVLGAYSYGVCLSYFLIDVYYYLWIPPMVRTQLSLAGSLHIYLYLAAIWVSVKPQAPLVWALLDTIFAGMSIAVAVTGRASISEYCTSSSLTLYWSASQFGYIPQDQLSFSDLTAGSLNESITLAPAYLQRACGFYASVIAANGVIMVLLVVTAIVQFKQSRMDYGSYIPHLTRSEKQQVQIPSGREDLGITIPEQNTRLEA